MGTVSCTSLVVKGRQASPNSDICGATATGESPLDSHPFHPGSVPVWERTARHISDGTLKADLERG
jgi:hypothetical protein